jgi:hypothetical protein
MLVRPRYPEKLEAMWKSLNLKTYRNHIAFLAILLSSASQVIDALVESNNSSANSQ